MISHFSILGDLYNHEDFDTESTDWYSYSWLSGRDNRLGLDLSSEISSYKTRWSDIAGDSWRDDSISGLSLNDMSVTLFATLLRIDQWGNVGSDAGSTPETLPDSWLFSISAEVMAVRSELVFTELVFNSNAEQVDDAEVYVAQAVIAAVSSEQQYFPNYFDSNAEPDAEGAPIVQSVVITNVTSTLQV